ncbi:MAG: hypothetical protein Q3979_05435 [Actinomycetaceae bacterium]|nr:hypothetical protein [Actinomycetaceae bacterium]
MTDTIQTHDGEQEGTDSPAERVLEEAQDVEKLREKARDVDVSENDDEFHELEHDRLEQANNLRHKFFYFGIGMTTACVCTSCFVAIALVFRGEMTPVIATAFITGLTVEALGIVAIIAKYLYSRD